MYNTGELVAGIPQLYISAVAKYIFGSKDLEGSEDYETVTKQKRVTHSRIILHKEVLVGTPWYSHTVTDTVTDSSDHEISRLVDDDSSGLAADSRQNKSNVSEIDGDSEIVIKHNFCKARSFRYPNYRIRFNGMPWKLYVSSDPLCSEISRLAEDDSGELAVDIKQPYNSTVSENSFRSYISGNDEGDTDIVTKQCKFCKSRSFRYPSYRIRFNGPPWIGYDSLRTFVVEDLFSDQPQTKDVRYSSSSSSGSDCVRLAVYDERLHDESDTT